MRMKVFLKVWAMMQTKQAMMLLPYCGFLRTCNVSKALLIYHDLCYK